MEISRGVTVFVADIDAKKFNTDATRLVRTHPAAWSDLGAAQVRTIAPITLITTDLPVK